ncbi:hypothetical protein J6590_024394 [Homalodisca vitripennis]|nr:hypothetical protein J6590_024394 [Homalodisca vitripennis]
MRVVFFLDFPFCYRRRGSFKTPCLNIVSLWAMSSNSALGSMARRSPVQVCSQSPSVSVVRLLRSFLTEHFGLCLYGLCWDVHFLRTTSDCWCAAGRLHKALARHPLD